MRLFFYLGILHPDYNCVPVVAWRCLAIVATLQCHFSFSHLISNPIFSTFDCVLEFALHSVASLGIPPRRARNWHPLPSS